MMRFCQIISLCVLCIGILPPLAKAQTIIRDTEIEATLSEWFVPIFKANNMDPSQVKIILVQDNRVNAFVAGGSNIFFFTGLIEMTDGPGELIGVMAHELGHIAGGHLIRGQEALEAASYESLLGTILGLGTALATGDSGAAAAGGAAGNSLATRRFLSKTRTFESSADQAAFTSMKRAGMNPEGLLTFMKKLEGEELRTPDQQSEYVRTHPLTQNRIQSMEAALTQPDVPKTNFPPKWYDQHARMKAKLTGFINPGHVDWEYNVSDQSVPARYARAIAAYRQNEVEKALQGMDDLIKTEPQNPYFHELKGQMLVDFGRPAEAIAPYRRALSLKSDSPLVRIALAHALSQQDGTQKDVIDLLRRAIREEPRSARAHRLLATAYGQSGQDALARLHLAEEALLQRKISYAKQQATLALNGLPQGSAGAIRAQDILEILNKSKN